MSALGFVEGNIIVGVSDELFLPRNCLPATRACPQGSCPCRFRELSTPFLVVLRLFMVIPRFVHGLSTVHVLQRKRRVHAACDLMSEGKEKASNTI